MNGKMSRLSFPELVLPVALALAIIVFMFALSAGCGPGENGTGTEENGTEVHEEQKEGKEQEEQLEEQLEENAATKETQEEHANDRSLENNTNNGIEARETDSEIQEDISADYNSSSENRTEPCCWDYQPADMAPKPGWDTVDLEGLTREELVEVLGCPPHVIRQTSVVSADYNKELWIYHPYEKDPTGLYIWLKGDVFHQSKLEEFNGFWCHQMGDPDFWE